LTHSEDSLPDNEQTLAYADDTLSYCAHLVTHETFGCVQHEPLLGDHGGTIPAEKGDD
jgi:hypothetical protein